ncbi:hypothetical protein LAWI1_G006042 [Lachnellula willkommii]|uniref:DUF4470 domain-containing protein n=1 Tax=Lachnellula willkommii TaxID=215461 RepID=A0A559MIP5_9HELO|nr:hypothetical protein LAWI1_G006042 [Lachnellula willkommii]
MATSNSEAEPTATSLREEGNAFYNSGKLLEGKLSLISVALDQPDSLPPRNLSAALYELGRYKECIAIAHKASTLVRAEGMEDMQQQEQKLENRIAKAKVHVYKSTDTTQLQTRKILLEEILRYKPSTFTTTEYFSVGHDTATSLFDPVTISTYKPDLKSVSFFFGGAGDARNVLRTLIDIADQEKKKEVPERSYHVTVNDIAKSAISRNIILWMLLEDLSGVEPGSDKSEMLLNTIFFIYISTVMPPYAFDQMTNTIDRALVLLTKGEQPVSWLYLHEKDMPKYIEALTDWRGKARDFFTSAEMIERVSMKMWLSKVEADGQFRKEKQMYISAAVLYPSEKVLRQQDPKMLELIKKHSTKSEANVGIFTKHLRDNWHPNPTLIDVQYYNNLLARNQEQDFDVGFDPFQSLVHFPADEMVTKPLKPTRLFDHMSPFFQEVANAITFLGNRLQVEAILGDYVDVAEKIQMGFYSSVTDDDSAGRLRPKEFPTHYDRVHLGNVPDYMGGHLTTFLYALPLCRRCPSVFVKANCLRNSSSFNTVLDYLSEYQLITDDKMLLQLAQTIILIRENKDFPWPMADYTYYTWLGPDAHSYPNLLPRKAFTKWFYGLFFRWALPFNQNPRIVSEIILSPLNLTILFRLIPHLCTLGYPAHWLSEVLTNIITNNVITTARPPRTKPMRPADVKRKHAEKKLNHSLLPPLGKSGFKAFKTNLRLILDPSWGDEVDGSMKGGRWDMVREKGLRVWSTLKWDAEKREASAWMHEGFVEGVGGMEWACGLYRTDVWMPVFEEPAIVRGAVKKGELWGP